MENTPVTHSFFFRKFLPVGFISIGVVSLAMLFFVITDHLTKLREAPGDNLTWALSQIEVEILLLSDEFSRAEKSPTSDLKPLRQRFDNVYSRAHLVFESPAFAAMRQDEKFTAQLNRLLASLNMLVPFVDGNDSDLRVGSSDILEKLTVIRDDVHRIALTGIRLRSVSFDLERSDFAKLMIIAASVSFTLIIFLIITLFFILRQHGINQKISSSVEQANTRLKSAFQVSLDAIIVADAQGIILDFNASAEKVFGFSREEVIGAQMAELIVPQQFREAHYAGIARFNKTLKSRIVGGARVEFTALRKSGEEFPMEISIGRASDDGGPIFISYLRDITERLLVEQDLKKARDEALQAENAKSNFLAVMSHEIRTPLNGLFGTMELLQKTKLTPAQARYVDIAQRSGNTLLHQVNDVLDVSRIDEGKLNLDESVFNLSQFFKDIITTNDATASAQNNGLVLRMEVAETMFIKADEHRLRQIAFNLLSNALKFTKNGTIVLQVSILKASVTAIDLEFSVSDTGVGIAVESQARIFDRFFTEEKSYDRLAYGAGLGLTICKQITDLMRGEITFESKKGLGTTFFVNLPMKIAASPSAPIAEVHADIDETLLDGKSVLLVEDNEINRVIVTEMLQSLSMKVEQAHNGQEAVDMANKHSFFAVLMDISMPVMNGLDATTIIRESKNPNQETPIIALTAHALVKEQAYFLDAGMNRCLSKPVSRRDLARVLVSVLSEPPKKGLLAGKGDDANAVLDAEIFQSLKTIFKNGKLEKLVDKFVAEIEKLLTQANDLIAAENLDELAKMSHKSIGAAGMIGALPFQSVLRNLEQAAKDNNLKNTSKALSQAVKVWPKTLEALRSSG